MKKVLVTVLLFLPLVLSAQNYRIEWKTVEMDGSRTGVTVPTADNVASALGTVDGTTYVAPNGRKFTGVCTVAAAKALIGVQPQMAKVKEVIGHAPEMMTRRGPESVLGDWCVDRIMAATAEATGKKVDFGIMNGGGIRVDMPEGDIVADDIMSMFPFKNTLCYVALKGSRVKEIFSDMAAGMVQVIGGARVVVKDRKIVSLTIGGQEVEDDKVYGLATIDFLLDGGDNLFLAKDALELIDTKVYILDVMLPYVKSLTAAGMPIEYKTDGRIQILDMPRRPRKK